MAVEPVMTGLVKILRQFKKHKLIIANQQLGIAHHVVNNAAYIGKYDTIHQKTDCSIPFLF